MARLSRAEREAIGAVADALSCPLPASGSRSTSVAGLSQYADDMRHAAWLAKRVLTTLAGGGSYKGQLADDVADLRAVMPWARDQTDP